MKLVDNFVWEVLVELTSDLQNPENNKIEYKYSPDLQGPWYGIDPEASSGTGDFGLHKVQEWMQYHGRWKPGEGKMNYNGQPSPLANCKNGDRCLFRFNDFLLTFVECVANTMGQVNACKMPGAVTDSRRPADVAHQELYSGKCTPSEGEFMPPWAINYFAWWVKFFVILGIVILLIVALTVWSLWQWNLSRQVGAVMPARSTDSQDLSRGSIELKDASSSSA